MIEVFKLYNAAQTRIILSNWLTFPSVVASIAMVNVSCKIPNFCLKAPMTRSTWMRT